MRLNDKYTFVPDMNFGFRFELVDEFIQIVPSNFGLFNSHHQWLLENVKIVLFTFFQVFFEKFHKLRTTIISGVSIVVSCIIIYVHICVVGQSSFI